ncbi:hypothetical protein ACXN5S_04395 [Pseudoroseicyclus sp. H15]
MTSCINVVSHSRVKVEENGRKAIFLNDCKDEFEVGKIDGCLITEGIRADYFVSCQDKSVLVELKGCNVDHACTQLFTSAEHENVKNRLRANIGFLVICSRVPAASTKTQLAQQKARRIFKARFQVFCRRRELNIHDC